MIGTTLSSFQENIIQEAISRSSRWTAHERIQILSWGHTRRKQGRAPNLQHAFGKKSYAWDFGDKSQFQLCLPKQEGLHTQIYNVLSGISIPTFGPW